MTKWRRISKKSLVFFVAISFCAFFSFDAMCLAKPEGRVVAEDFESREQGDLNGQDGWGVTNYHNNTDNAVDVSGEFWGLGQRYAKISNHDSMIVARDFSSLESGVLKFRMKHDKKGLFYFYAFTSDEGSQLLLSIQFNEAGEILIEEASGQTVLVSDYSVNEWYSFVIEFDKAMGQRGGFRIRVNDDDYREYGYVRSESFLFDFSRIVFGSDSDGRRTVSAFDDVEVESSPEVIETGAVTDDQISSPAESNEQGDAVLDSIPEPTVAEDEDGLTSIIAL